MKKYLLKLKLLFIIVSAVMIAFVIILLLPTSCKKDVSDNEENKTDLPGEYDVVVYTLKEPYLIYNNNPTSMCVAVHTQHSVNGSDGKKVEIRWKYSHENEYHGYSDMAHHKYVIPWEYGQDHEDHYVWLKNFPSGSFSPGSKIDYEVKVTYTILLIHQHEHYYGSFYTNDPDATSLTFYSIGDTQEDGPSGGIGGGPHYFVHVMNSLAEDMDKDYANRYKLLIHCGDFNYNGPREYFQSRDNSWNMEFFGRTGNNQDCLDRSKVMWVLARVPVMGTIGNHDWMWDGHPERNSIREYVAAYPNDMYWQRDHHISIGSACDPDWDYTKHPEHLYYSFDYGPAHFISLSSYPADKHDQSSHFGHASPQVSWLTDDLAKNTKEWIFVFTHIPIVDGKGGPHNKPVFNACEPLFQLYGVDAVLQGHEHLYARRHYNGIPYFVLGGGGGFLMQYDQPDAEVLEERMWFWSRFEILNNDSCHVYVECAHDYDTGKTSGKIDDFYIYNRQRK